MNWSFSFNYLSEPERDNMISAIFKSVDEATGVGGLESLAQVVAGSGKWIDPGVLHKLVVKIIETAELLNTGQNENEDLVGIATVQVFSKMGETLGQGCELI